MLKDMILRGRFEDIIFEFSLANNSQRTLIICDGLPSVPKQKELLIYLNNNGFDVFYPRYKGTWESGGEFLARSPSDDIADFIKFLKKGSVTELYNNTTFSVKNSVSIVGSSFGGTVALALADNSDVDKIVAFSPIVNLKSHNNGEEQDLNQLGEFMSRAFGNGYRFKKENWEAMTGGKIFNAPEKISANRSKDILIAYDLSDKEIDHKKIADYCSKNNIRSIVSENAGHLSFSKISQSLWTQVFEFLL